VLIVAAKGNAVSAVLDDRAAQVLRLVVEDYIETAEPVGSRTISKRMGQLSPATIRNIMADLEDSGFLAQPHTSAGRIPTAAGFRYYVDYLLERQRLLRSERDQLLRTAGAGAPPPETVIRQVGRLLSQLSGQACVVVVASPDDQKLRGIRLLRAGRDNVLLVAVMQGGWVQHRLIENEPGLSDGDLEKIGNYLDELASGLTLSQLRTRILQEMRHEKAHYDRVLTRALALSARAFPDSPAGEVYVEGRTNILEQPEFVEDVDKLKRILRAFEEKSVVVRLLDRVLDDDATRVSIGAENPVEELPDIAVVASSLHRGGSPLGSIGLVGPVRMNYSRIIPLVEYTAALLGSAHDHR
jgi:heat-inducible transcriptional repressor